MPATEIDEEDDSLQEKPKKEKKERKSNRKGEIRKKLDESKIIKEIEMLSKDKKDLKKLLGLEVRELSKIMPEIALKTVDLSKKVVDDLIEVLELKRGSYMQVTDEVMIERLLDRLESVKEGLIKLEKEIEDLPADRSLPKKSAAKVVAAGFTILGIASIFLEGAVVGPIALILEGVAVLLGC